MNNKKNVSFIKEFTLFIKEIMPFIVLFALGGAILAGVRLAQAKAARELKLHSFRLKMEWFGGEIISHQQSDAEVWKEKYVEGSSCINDPEIIRNVEKWQTDGISGWASLTDEKCNKILDKIARKKGTDSQIYMDCYALMYGGYDIFGIGVEEKVDGVKNDMLRFLNAIIAICLEDFDVKAHWDALYI